MNRQVRTSQRHSSMKRFPQSLAVAVEGAAKTPAVRRLLCAALLLLVSAICSSPVRARAEGPAVTVVTGTVISKLERYAGEELTRLLVELFDAKVTVDESGVVPADAGHLILFGNPKTNPALDQSVVGHWPEDLSEQGHLLVSVERDGKTALVVGGGSPVATLWAVYELGHSFGMRYLLHEDFAPIDAPEFTLDGFDEVLEPKIRVRGWRTIDAGAAGQEAWGLADHEKLLVQLAKLKFNHLTLVTHPSQPFYDFEAGDAAKKDGGVLWGGEDFPVSGDTAGRAVFAGAKVFENPDFVGAATDKERVAAGLQLTRGIVTRAQELGMTAVFEEAGSADPEIKVLPLAQPRGGVLPQFFSGLLASQLAGLQVNKQDGFAIQCWIPGNLNPDVYYISRTCFDGSVSPAEALESLVTPICGEGVAERLLWGFAAIRENSALIEKHDPDFAVPDAKMFMEHFESAEPAPEWWADAKEGYGKAVNEMYRGNTRARGGARPFILYHAKYFTFALHYMTAVESVRAAGIARAAGDEAAWVENLELAVEAMHNALGIYAEVARDNSDRGVIAVLNKYAYRPLVEALNEAPLP